MTLTFFHFFFYFCLALQLGAGAASKFYLELNPHENYAAAMCWGSGSDEIQIFCRIPIQNFGLDSD
jgi:hypothetical protein